MGQVVQNLVGLRKALGFDPEAGGSRGGLWAEEGQALTQVLPDAFCFLWVEQTEGEGGSWETRVEVTMSIQAGDSGAGRSGGRRMSKKWAVWGDSEGRADGTSGSSLPSPRKGPHTWGFRGSRSQ